MRGRGGFGGGRGGSAALMLSRGAFGGGRGGDALFRALFSGGRGSESMFESDDEEDHEQEVDIETPDAIEGQQVQHVAGQQQQPAGAPAPSGGPAPASSGGQAAPTNYDTSHIPKGYDQLADEAIEAAVQAGVPVEWASDPEFITLINKESGWNPDANNPTSTAHGLGQFLSSTRQNYGVEDHGDTGTVDPVTQLRATYQYIRDRYGTPDDALAFHRRNNWY